MRNPSHLAAWSLLSLSLAGCGAEPPWNVLLVTLDTTRADRLGCYGKENARTSTLDRLAAEGVLFENAVSSNPVTLPSHSTIMTGTYPPVHGVRDNGLFKLPDASTTLAEILHRHGYSTAAAVGAFPLDRRFGLDQGFDLYDDHVTVAAEDFQGVRIETKSGVFFDERPAARVNDAILPWLRDGAGRPFFAWIHYFDPHQPHAPPAPFNQLFHHDPYQGEIAYADHSLGAVLAELEAQGLDEQTVVVVMADHGEGLGEHHEETHSLLAYDTTLHVPLVFRIPGQGGGRRIEQRVGTVDVLPTLLELLGLEIPAGVQGRSLAPLMRGRGSIPADRVRYYAETLTPRLSHGWGELRALYDDRFKYIHGPRPELFDLEEDPRELHDLVDALPDESRRMRTELEGFLGRSSGHSIAAVLEVDEETRQRLAALGYVSGGGDAPETVREELRSDGIAPQDRVDLNTLESNLRLYLSEQRFLEAREAASRLAELDPDKDFYRAMLARALLGLGQPDRAAAIAEEADPRFAGGHQQVFLRVAMALAAKGEGGRGLALAQRVVAGQESAGAYQVLGEMQCRLGDLDACEDALERALEIEPDNARARLGLAIQQVQTGDLEAAEAQFAELVRRHPLFARGHFNYGVLLLQSGRWREALTHLQRCTQIEPTHWQAHYAQLTAHVALGEREQAESVLETLSSCPDAALRANARKLLEGSW